MTGFGEPLVDFKEEERGHEPKIVAKLWKSENVKEFILRLQKCIITHQTFFVASQTTL